MSMKRIWLPIVVILSILAGSCSGKTEDVAATVDNKEKVLTYAFTFSRNVLDPGVDKYYMGLRCGALETLTKIDTEQMEVVPWLAESWSSLDGVNWEFKIREGAKFSDGSDLTAEAVKASIEQLIGKNKGLNNALKIASMEADGQILKIVTKEVHPNLFSELAHPQTAVIVAGTSDVETNPIGTGPYAIANFVPNAEIDLVKNSYYWDGEPKLDKVKFLMNSDANSRMMALQSGDVDVISHAPIDSLSVLEGDENLAVDSVQGISRVHDVLYNVTKVNNPYLRKGIDALIDRQVIVDTVLGGQAVPAKGPFVEGYSFAANYSVHPFDLELALENFGKAGLKVSDGMVSQADGSPLSLKFVIYTAQPAFPPIAQMIQANATQLGIEMEIAIVDGIDEYLLNNEDWDMAMYSCFKVPRGDAGYYLNTFIMPGAMYAYSRIQNDYLGDLISRFNTEPDVVSRSALAKEAAQIIDDENYISYIAVPNIISAYNKRVIGWKTDKIEYYMITKDLDIE